MRRGGHDFEIRMGRRKGRRERRYLFYMTLASTTLRQRRKGDKRECFRTVHDNFTVLPQESCRLAHPVRRRRIILFSIYGRRGRFPSLPSSSFPRETNDTSLSLAPSSSSSSPFSDAKERKSGWRKGKGGEDDI